MSSDSPLSLTSNSAFIYNNDILSPAVDASEWKDPSVGGESAAGPKTYSNFVIFRMEDLVKIKLFFSTERWCSLYPESFLVGGGSFVDNFECNEQID